MLSIGNALPLPGYAVSPGDGCASSGCRAPPALTLTVYGAGVERIRPRFTAVLLPSRRLVLEPLRLEHAEEAAVAFDDERLHTYMGAAPASVEQLRARFARQTLGRSPDGSEDWLNWMARDRDSGLIAGTVQSTVYHSGDHYDGVHLVAEVAWVVATPFQGQGVATEAATAMIGWLRESGVDVLIAHIHPENRPSIGVARNLGLRPTTTVYDGELRWTSSP
jgi:RimJ/RimL family protein N-acetyltransferase